MVDLGSVPHRGLLCAGRGVGEGSKGQPAVPVGAVMDRWVPVVMGQEGWQPGSHDVNESPSASGSSKFGSGLHLAKCQAG